jgi:hypothetical protein
MNILKQTIIGLTCVLLMAVGLVTIYSTDASAECDGVKTAIINCTVPEDTEGIKGSGLWQVLIIAINVLVGIVGVAALAGVIYGAVLYTSAGGNMEQTKKGMQIIGNVAIGVIAFGLMYVGLNFIVPGGVIG